MIKSKRTSTATCEHCRVRQVVTGAHNTYWRQLEDKLRSFGWKISADGSKTYCPDHRTRADRGEVRRAVA